MIVRLEAALTFRPLLRNELAFVARKGHPLANARSLGELAGADWLTLVLRAMPGEALDQTLLSTGMLTATDYPVRVL